MVGVRIRVTGIVQGVGFRPFIYGLAKQYSLNGWVRNTSSGVDIVVEGEQTDLEHFVNAIRPEAPPLSHVEEILIDQVPANGYTDFEILHSQAYQDEFQPISPDVGICRDCLEELFDPNNRRFLYPFINCTNCGPRFTIIQDIPYDRPNTTMSMFDMCPDCSSEYHNPQDRRFHAQPIACPKCGPQVWLEYSHPDRIDSNHELLISQAAIEEAQRLLLAGKIVAIKGLGGFHLACDATNATAVNLLRNRKLRVDKPFALMMANLGTIESHCIVSDKERELLLSHECPIVLLERKPDTPISREVAPAQNTLGVMLPYTPLHHLLFASLSSKDFLPPSALVMTSGNLSEEPIAIDNDEARTRLTELADAHLMHNRPIHLRCDDSVMRIISFPGVDAYSQVVTMPIRRSRGYAPFPVYLAWESPCILAVGAELKNTFCVTREKRAFMSHHIGDLENYETLSSFEDGISHFERIFRIKPELLAYDLHPDYLSTRYAILRSSWENIPSLGVQHHHAHVASCMIDNGLKGDRLYIGISLDGTGYGIDGSIWGGEFLITDYRGFQRAAHLRYTRLPGGEKAIREPWRMALAWLNEVGLEWDEDLPPVRFARELSTRNSQILSTKDDIEILQHQLRTGLNTPMTSSIGRLFDSVSALIGVRFEANYEAQAAIELEALVDPEELGSYDFTLLTQPAEDRVHLSAVKYAIHDLPLLGKTWVVDPEPMFNEIVRDLRGNQATHRIAARFHNTLSIIVTQISALISAETGISEVILSGGVWQNRVLLRKTIPSLLENGLKVYFHQLVPCNDGGIALGQAAIAGNALLDKSWR